jgi:hypothetical protein
LPLLKNGHRTEKGAGGANLAHNLGGVVDPCRGVKELTAKIECEPTKKEHEGRGG